MKGYFYNVDDWIKTIEENKKPKYSDGAKWWLDRVKVRALS